ncbi:cytochrome d ubiquinol oxidase subunit II [Pseudomonas sp. Marseille-QA0892]
MNAEWLALAAAAAVAFSFLCYVLLDGTVLGVGMMVPLTADERDRQTLSYSLLPIWDGNETWLVLGAAALLAMFPQVYAGVLTALYIPVFLMLLALIVRGVLLEYRDHFTPRMRRATDVALGIASALAAFSQGVSLGVLLGGLDVNAPERSLWAAFAFYPVMCGLAMVFNTFWLGAGWALWRTTDRLQRKARQWAWIMAPIAWAASLLAIAGALLVVQDHRPLFSDRPPAWYWIFNGALLAGVGSMVLFVVALFQRRVWLPLVGMLGWVAGVYVLGLCLVFPLIAPPTVDIFAASVSPRSQAFVLIGFGLFAPVTLAYSTYSFWIFKGKVQRAPVRSQDEAHR